MQHFILDTKTAMGVEAARQGAQLLREAIAANGSADLIVATGASQFEMLDALIREEVDWSKVTGFHLDEYLGLPTGHPASFCKYLKERLVDKVPLGAFHYVDGQADPHVECDRLNGLIVDRAIDVAFVGIGENGHLAFNDPPADFETERPYLVVELDDACRRQQAGEGWFPTLDDVPRQAISMSIHRIMHSKHIICTVPDERKADAVFRSLKGGVTPEVPASILQQHPDARLFLDRNAALRLDGSASE